MAYGTNAPFGFQPRYYLNGSTWSNQTRRYRIPSGYATSLFNGDLVTAAASGTIVQATIGGAVLGVLQGVEWYDANNNYVFSNYWPANTVTNGDYATAFVVDDPNVIFSVQVSTSSNANQAVAVGMAIADIFENANYGLIIAANGFAPVNGPGGTYTPPNNPGAGSTITGVSGMYLDQSTFQTGNATFTCKIVDIEPNTNPQQLPYSTTFGPNNNQTVGVFNNALVILNNHIYKGGTGTAGV